MHSSILEVVIPFNSGLDTYRVDDSQIVQLHAVVIPFNSGLDTYPDGGEYQTVLDSRNPF